MDFHIHSHVSTRVLIDDVNSSQIGEAQLAHFADLREALLDARRGTVTHRATTRVLLLSDLTDVTRPKLNFFEVERAAFVSKY